jgi:hypothetical protein
MVVTFGEYPECGKGIRIQDLPWRNGFFGKGFDVGLVNSPTQTR